MERKVFCKKLNSEKKGLDKPPFSGDLGQIVFEQISEEAWKMWKDDMMIKVINEYRLNLSLEGDYNTLVEQMKAFLGLSDSTVLEVENANRGKSHT